MGQTLSAELRLTQIFNEQLKTYEAAMKIIDTIESKFQQHHDAETDLERLNRVMSQVAAQDREAATLKDAVFSVPDQLSAEIRDVSRKLEGTVELMLGRVHSVEELARASRDRLSPQVSFEVTTKQMLNAYQSS